MHVGGLIFYHGFFFLSFHFLRRLISELTDRNSTKIGHMLGSKCNLKTHVQNLGHPLPLQIGTKNHLFGRLRHLTANLTVYIKGRALSDAPKGFLAPKCRLKRRLTGYYCYLILRKIINFLPPDVRC